MELPILSIITVTYNSISNIESTIKNVLVQNFNSFEFIVIDGGSTDGTLDILKKYEKKISFISSEPDLGIYDAMNKGVKNAKGNWVIFMNSGDLFSKFSKQIFENTVDKENFDVLYGDVFINKNGVLFLDKARPIYELNYSLNFCHQSCFVKSDYLRRFPFSLKYKISSDFNFFLNLKIVNGKFKYLEAPISIFEYGGTSNKFFFKYVSERIFIIFTNHVHFGDKIYFVFKFVKMLFPINFRIIKIYINK